MKVICVGYWKTGTKSLSKALKLLGYENIYDYEEQFLYLNDLWMKFFDGSVKDTDIYEAFKDVDVLIDGPTILFWSEIYRVFPDAKVILTMRDEDGWWKSFKRMQDKFFQKPLLRVALILSPTGYQLSKYVNKVFGFALGIDSFSLTALSWSANKRLYGLRFRMHNAHVYQTIPIESMLVHRSPDGWPSLCSYLDKDVPDLPYPHKNKNASLFDEELMQSQLMSKIVKEMGISLACLASFAGVVLTWYFVM